MGAMHGAALVVLLGLSALGHAGCRGDRAEGNTCNAGDTVIYNGATYTSVVT